MSSTKKYFNISGETPPQGTPGGQPPYDKTIYDLEKNIFDSLNEFNQIYSNYLRCSQEIRDDQRKSEINTALKNTLEERGCSTDAKNTRIADVRTASDKVSAKVDAYKLAFGTFEPSDSSAQESAGKVATLVNNYNEIVQKRNNLDLKIDEVNRVMESQYMELKGQGDSTKYTNILLTVLATSLIYYIFVKL